jgi:hypothetical protein
MPLPAAQIIEKGHHFQGIAIADMFMPPPNRSTLRHEYHHVEINHL